MSGLRARMLVGAAAVVGVVAIVLAILVVAISDLRDSAARARHSEAVIAAANKLEVQLLEIETGHRGFVLSGNELFLAPWRSGIEAFPTQARLLEQLVAGDAQQEARARRIERDGRAYIESWSRPLVATASRDPE